MLTNRKAIPKEVRLQVYHKYNCRCAYCGCWIAYKDMQVDHLESVYRAELANKPVDESIDNYMPACRACNFYKSSMSLEDFREMVSTLHERLEKLFIYRLAKKYGMVVEKPMPRFYFEVYNEETKEESTFKNDTE